MIPFSATVRLLNGCGTLNEMRDVEGQDRTGTRDWREPAPISMRRRERGDGSPDEGFIVADDHALVRHGVRLVLEGEFPEETVVEAVNLDSTLEALAAHPEALLLIDLAMPGMDGVESLRVLREEFPGPPMAVLSATDDWQTIKRALDAGMNGYVLKSGSPDELLYAVRTIRSGHLYVPAGVARAVSHIAAPTAHLAPASAPPTAATSMPAENLTARQRDVLGRLMQGHSNKQIARDLDIGEGTVKIHLAAIFRALGARNRTDAVMIAARLGLKP